MRRGLIVLFLATLLGLCSAGPTAATGPTREPAFFGADTITGACAFPVRLVPVVNREILKVFPSGRALISGRLVARVTNRRTGRSLVVNASGPATFVPRTDSVVFYGRGRGLYVFFPDELGPRSDGGLFLANGLVIQEFAGDLVVRRFPRNRRNLCTAIAQ